ncbi:hypothetical protein ACHMZP_07550 [Rhodococcus baikonurensis]|uniref:hypothetical protein n=1 Tax=Rhodococcus baikonurensis TaxID=172041 RepID=UPI0037ADACB3
MARLFTPEQRKKHFWAKLAVTVAVFTVPIAVLAAPASADTVNHDVTQTDNSWHGDQGGDHSHDWDHGGNGGWNQGDNWNQGNDWNQGNQNQWQGGQGPAPAPIVNPFAGLFGSS